MSNESEADIDRVVETTINNIITQIETMDDSHKEPLITMEPSKKESYFIQEHLEMKRTNISYADDDNVLNDTVLVESKSDDSFQTTDSIYTETLERVESMDEHEYKETIAVSNGEMKSLKQFVGNVENISKTVELVASLEIQETCSRGNCNENLTNANESSSNFCYDKQVDLANDEKVLLKANIGDQSNFNSSHNKLPKTSSENYTIVKEDNTTTDPCFIKEDSKFVETRETLSDKIQVSVINNNQDDLLVNVNQILQTLNERDSSLYEYSHINMSQEISKANFSINSDLIDQDQNFASNQDLCNDSEFLTISKTSVEFSMGSLQNEITSIENEKPLPDESNIIYSCRSSESALNSELESNNNVKLLQNEESNYSVKASNGDVLQPEDELNIQEESNITHINNKTESLTILKTNIELEPGQTEINSCIIETNNEEIQSTIINEPSLVFKQEIDITTELVQNETKSHFVKTASEETSVVQKKSVNTNICNQTESLVSETKSIVNMEDKNEVVSSDNKDLNINVVTLKEEEIICSDNTNKILIVDTSNIIDNDSLEINIENSVDTKETNIIVNTKKLQTNDAGVTDVKNAFDSHAYTKNVNNEFGKHNISNSIPETLVNKIHDMNWLKNNTKSTAKEDSRKDKLHTQNMPKKEERNDTYFEGTKKNSNKRRVTGQKNKNEKTNATNNVLDTVKLEEQQPNVPVVPNRWNNNTTKELFPHVHSQIIDRKKEEDDLDMAIVASICTAQQESDIRKMCENTMKIKVENDPDENEWGKIRPNLPDKSVENQGKGFVDQYGRVDGYLEKHLFMGKGARKKEQEFLKTLSVNNKQEVTNQDQPMKQPKIELQSLTKPPERPIHGRFGKQVRFSEPVLPTNKSDQKSVLGQNDLKEQKDKKENLKENKEFTEKAQENIQKNQNLQSYNRQSFNTSDNFNKFQDTFNKNKNFPDKLQDTTKKMEDCFQTRGFGQNDNYQDKSHSSLNFNRDQSYNDTYRNQERSNRNQNFSSYSYSENQDRFSKSQNSSSNNYSENQDRYNRNKNFSSSSQLENQNHFNKNQNFPSNSHHENQDRYRNKNYYSTSHQENQDRYKNKNFPSNSHQENQEQQRNRNGFTHNQEHRDNTNQKENTWGKDDHSLQKKHDYNQKGRQFSIQDSKPPGFNQPQNKKDSSISIENNDRLKPAGFNQQHTKKDLPLSVENNDRLQQPPGFNKHHDKKDYSFPVENIEKNVSNPNFRSNIKTESVNSSKLPQQLTPNTHSVVSKEVPIETHSQTVVPEVKNVHENLNIEPKPNVVMTFEGNQNIQRALGLNLSANQQSSSTNIPNVNHPDTTRHYYSSNTLPISYHNYNQFMTCPNSMMTPNGAQCNHGLIKQAEVSDVPFGCMSQLSKSEMMEQLRMNEISNSSQELSRLQDKVNNLSKELAIAQAELLEAHVKLYNTAQTQGVASGNTPSSCHNPQLPLEYVKYSCPPRFLNETPTNYPTQGTSDNFPVDQLLNYPSMYIPHNNLYQHPASFPYGHVQRGMPQNDDQRVNQFYKP